MGLIRKEALYQVSSTFNFTFKLPGQTPRKSLAILIGLMLYFRSAVADPGGAGGPGPLFLAKSI